MLLWGIACIYRYVSFYNSRLSKGVNLGFLVFFFLRFILKRIHYDQSENECTNTVHDYKDCILKTIEKIHVGKIRRKYQFVEGSQLLSLKRDAMSRERHVRSMIRREKLQVSPCWRAAVGKNLHSTNYHFMFQNLLGSGDKSDPVGQMRHLISIKTILHP